jgi:hypothetical protein
VAAVPSPFTDTEKDTNMIDLKSLAATVLAIPSDVTIIYVYEDGRSKVQFDASDALDHTSAEWGPWYGDRTPQRNKNITVDGVDFVAYETGLVKGTENCTGPWEPAPGYDDLQGPLACEVHGIACMSLEVQEWRPDTSDGST